MNELIVSVISHDTDVLSVVNTVFQEGRHDTCIIQHQSLSLAINEFNEARYIPNIIIADVCDNHEAMSEDILTMRSMKTFRAIPIIALLPARDAQYSKSLYNSLTNCVVNKPLQEHILRHTLDEIESFWFTVAKLPYSASF